jgi:uncharacterized membrane protein YgcG
MEYLDRIRYFISRYWMNVCVGLLVLATFYNSWSVEQTNQKVVTEAKVERTESAARENKLVDLVTKLQHNYDELAESKEEDQRLHRELLIWLRSIGVIVPERFIPKEAADPATIRSDGDDKDNDGRRDPEPRSSGGGDDPKAQNPDKGNGGSGNGSNNGGGKNNGGGSDNDDDGPGKSGDNKGDDGNSGKGNDDKDKKDKKPKKDRD